MAGNLDAAELIAMGASVAASVAVVRTEARAVVSKGALNVKTDWRTNAVASARSHGRLYPYGVSYDLVEGPDVIEAVIGPEDHKARRQSFLAAVLEFGSSHNAPHNDGGRALDTEEPRFIAQAEALALRALGL